jgi:polyhydroxyalkanoate synthase
VSRDPAAPALNLLLNGRREALDGAATALRTGVVADDRLADALSATAGGTPSEVVHTENKLELRRYEPLTDGQHDIPLLVVYALINRPSILDLQRDRSVVRRLLEAGHDVYLVDWNEPSRLDRHLGLADYVERYLHNCVDAVCERAGSERVNVLGYCMGGTMAAIYTALHPGRVNALALLAAPLHVDDTGGVLERWGDGAHYDPRAVADALGNVPAEFLAAGFTAMDPVADSVSKYVRLADRLENEDVVENFARVERWLADGVDMAGETYVEFVEAIYQEDRLYRNELSVGGRDVDVSAIDVPLLQVVGRYDSLVPPAASTPFNEVVGSEDTATIDYPTGHVGLAISAGAHRDVWPEVAEWFLEQSPGRTLADVVGEGVEQALGVDIETDVTVGGVDELAVSVADADGPVARAVVGRTTADIVAFLERALGVDIEVEPGTDEVRVRVVRDGTAERVVVGGVGEALRREIAEAVAGTDLAAVDDLEDIEGIGPTYGDRLRATGIDSVAALAAADPDVVADAARTSTTLARRWVERARTRGR